MFLQDWFLSLTEQVNSNSKGENVDLGRERDEGRQRQCATVPGADPQYPAEDIPGPTMTGGARVKYPAKIVVLVRPLVLGKGQNVLDWITLR